MRRDRLGLLGAPVAVAASGLVGAAVLAAVDVSSTSLLPPCPFLAITGLWCPFCGGTRALDALVAGDLGAALGLNLLVVLAVPVVVAEWARWTAGRARGRPTSLMNVSTRVLAAVTVLAVLYAVLRNLPGMEMLAPPS
jgi:hypothetical protein